MNRIYLTILFIGFTSLVKAQTYQLADLESQFLQNNYALIASKYNIERTEAEIVQEKLWPNPNLTVSEVNLWKTYQIEEQPPLFGTYGVNQQVTVELEQLIETAGKRKKRVALKQLEKNNAVFEFEELMRSLKKELRQTYYTLYKVQTEELLLNNMVALFQQMSDQYERQTELKNIPKAEYFRMQTELIALQKEQVALENEKIENIHKLRVLTQNNALEISKISFPKQAFATKNLPIDLQQAAKQNNIGLKQQQNETQMARQQLLLEQAQRVPDLNIQIGYDRGGNIMRDFIGVGVSVDLPIFNNNKGAIKAAKHTIDQQEKQQQALETALDHSVQQLQSQLGIINQSLKKWSGMQTKEHEQMIENYKKNLQTKQITLLEFLDFTQAYREAQQAYTELVENYHHTIEELNYLTGKEL